MPNVLPPYSTEERCREALMRSRVARWMSQRARDQRATRRVTPPGAGGAASTGARAPLVPPAMALSCLEGW